MEKRGVVMSIFSGETLMVLGEYAVSLISIWAVTVASGYGLIRWGFSEQISLQKAGKWVTAIIGSFGLLLMLLCLLPTVFHELLTDLLLPRLMCAASLHLFLLSLDRFIRHRHGGQGMIATRLVVAIIMVYVVLLIGALIVLKTSSEFLLRIAQLNSTYLMRGALLSTLFLEIYGGRCKAHNSQEKECPLDNSSNSLDNSTFNSSTRSYFDQFSED
ncbi:hypothetical protein EBU24_05305 [bacterium]|nr:hypothetical protein [bacterium]